MKHRAILAWLFLIVYWVYYIRMIGIHHSYCWYMTCFDSSSQAELLFSLCFTGPWKSSVPGCHDAEAAVFFSIRGQPRTQLVISVCVPAATCGTIRFCSSFHSSWRSGSPRTCPTSWIYQICQTQDDDLKSAVLNSILTQCMVSNRSGNNLHTYQCESDLYRGVMR